MNRTSFTLDPDTYDEIKEALSAHANLIHAPYDVDRTVTIVTGDLRLIEYLNLCKRSLKEDFEDEEDNTEAKDDTVSTRKKPKVKCPYCPLFVVDLDKHIQKKHLGDPIT